MHGVVLCLDGAVFLLHLCIVERAHERTYWTVEESDRMDFRPYSFGGAPLSPGPGLSTYPFPPSAYAGGRTPVAGGAPSSSAHGAPQSAMRRPAMASASARLSTGNNPSTAAASAAAAGLGGAAYPAASSSSSSSASSGSTGFSVAGADDMVNGRLQWKNIQSIVRATFGNVFAQLRSTQVSGGCGEGRVCVCVCVCVLADMEVCVCCVVCEGGALVSRVSLLAPPRLFVVSLLLASTVLCLRSVLAGTVLARTRVAGAAVLGRTMFGRTMLARKQDSACQERSRHAQCVHGMWAVLFPSAACLYLACLVAVVLACRACLPHSSVPTMWLR